MWLQRCSEGNYFGGELVIRTEVEINVRKLKNAKDLGKGWRQHGG